MSVASAVNVDGGRVRVPFRVADHAAFRAWATSGACPEDVRVAYIEGEIFVEMSPESTETHSKVKQAVNVALVEIVEGEDLGEVYPDGVLVSHSEASLSCEPDVFVVLWRTFEEERVRLTPKADRAGDYVEVAGTPDLVVEIVSDSSTRKDTQLLRRAYARAGVPEYWLVDARGEALAFEILHLMEGGYRPAAPVGRPQESRVLGRSFALERSRNRAGRFRYRLRTIDRA